MTTTIAKSERGDGELTAADMHRLLIGVPDDAVLEIHQDDPDDSRNAGHIGWGFRARWADR